MPTDGQTHRRDRADDALLHSGTDRRTPPRQRSSTRRSRSAHSQASAASEITDETIAASTHDWRSLTNTGVSRSRCQSDAQLEQEAFRRARRTPASARRSSRRGSALGRRTPWRPRAGATRGEGAVDVRADPLLAQARVRGPEQTTDRRLGDRTSAGDGHAHRWNRPEPSVGASARRNCFCPRAGAAPDDCKGDVGVLRWRRRRTSAWPRLR
jgi:hypothetical protein